MEFTGLLSVLLFWRRVLISSLSRDKRYTGSWRKPRPEISSHGRDKVCPWWIRDIVADETINTLFPNVSIWVVKAKTQPNWNRVSSIHKCLCVKVPEELHTFRAVKASKNSLKPIGTMNIWKSLRMSRTTKSLTWNKVEYTAFHHQRAIKMLRLHFWGPLRLSV